MELQFPVSLKKMTKQMSETNEAIGSLRPRDLAHKTKLTLVDDIVGYLPTLLSSPNRKFTQDLLKELGFEINSDNIVPEISRVVRLPNGFALEKGVNEEKKSEGVEKKFDNIGIKKRKRVYTGVIFVYHEGLTNAVKRKVRIADLL